MLLTRLVTYSINKFKEMFFMADSKNKNTDSTPQSGLNILQTFERFRFDVLTPNTNGAISVPISTVVTSPTTLATVNIRTDINDVVWLTATVGWIAATGVTNVRFKIFRGNPTTGTLISSALAGGESGFERNYVTSFSHVDTNLPTIFTDQLYTLTAEVITAGTTATAVGPVTFTASEIDSQSILGITI